MRRFPALTICFRVRTACLVLALFAVTPPAPPAGDAPPVAVLASRPESTPLEGSVLDLAFVDDDRLAVLFADGVALYERAGATLRRTDHRALEAPIVARAPAGIIVAEAGAFWVGTNTNEGAVLFATEGGRLQETERAGALPFAGSPMGARLPAGTNLVEVTIPGLGSGPHLRAGGGASPWAIAPDGRLGAAHGWTGVHVGSAAALLWPGTWIASSPAPPGAGDALLVTRGGPEPPDEVLAFPAPAAVTAIGARWVGDRALVAAAVAEGGRHRLVLVEVAHARP